RASHFSSVLQCDSRYRFFRRTRGSTYARTYSALMAIVGALRLAILAPAVVLTTGGLKADFLRAFGKWARILGWSIGGQRWAAQLNAAVAHPTRKQGILQ